MCVIPLMKNKPNLFNCIYGLSDLWLMGFYTQDYIEILEKKKINDGICYISELEDSVLQRY